MARARVHQQSGQEEEARAAAEKATTADEEWAAPRIFLAESALVAGELATADRIVGELVDRDPRPAGVSRTVDLIQLIKDEELPADVVISYVEMKREAASDDLVKRLEKLTADHQSFLQLRELLALDSAEARTLRRGVEGIRSTGDSETRLRAPPGGAARPGRGRQCQG